VLGALEGMGRGRIGLWLAPTRGVWDRIGRFTMQPRTGGLANQVAGGYKSFLVDYR